MAEPLLPESRLPVNTTQYSTGWRSEPDGRGTWGLLYSCLFTLSLCVYSAIHVNIPPRGESGNLHFWRKVKWVVIAIFAPEIVLYSAWQQYYIATSFCRDMYNIKLERAGLPTLSRKSWFRRLADFVKRLDPRRPRRPRKTSQEKPEPRTLASATRLSGPAPSKFSLTYGYYVVMGGLVVDVSDIYDNVSWATLTPAGVLNLAKKTSWEGFYVSDEVIRDKSKADNLAKLLVILQVSWTLLQCVSRQALGYPLTVLEVHTLVHAACAMLMYALWFRKPLNVGDPSSVDGGSAENLALELVRSSGSAYAPFTTLKPQTQFQSGRVSEYETDEGNQSLQISATKFLGQILQQNSKNTSEACFLVFDTSRLPSARVVVTDPLMLHLIRPANHQRHPRESEGISSVSDEQVMWIERDARQSDLSGSHPNPLSASPSDGYSATLHRTQFVNADEVKVLVTGQTLASGIGPAALLTSPQLTELFTSRDLIANIFHLKSLAPKRMHIHEVDPGLKKLLPPYNTELSPRLLYHKITISLSQKDLLRWDRAGLAFAREIECRSLDELRASDLNRYLASSSAHYSAGYASQGSVIHTGPSQSVLIRPQFPRLRCLLKPIPEYRGSMYSGDHFLLRSPNFSLDTMKVLLDTDHPDNRGDTAIMTILCFLMISGAYAGVHLALWNYEFPTAVEGILWKIASCALGTPFGLMAGFLVIVLAILYPVLRLVECVPWVISLMRAMISLKNPRLLRPRTQATPLVGEAGDSHVIVDVESQHYAPNPSETAEQTAQAQRGSSDTHGQPGLAPQVQTGGQETHLGTEHVAQDIATDRQSPSVEKNSKDYLNLRSYMRTMLSIPLYIASGALVMALIAGVPLYILSRLYIVVEAFVSLRRVQAGVYETVTWAQYIPHF